MSAGAAAKVETIRTADPMEQRVPLSEVLAGAPGGQEPVPGFVAWYEGSPWHVRAVLDRTATLEHLSDRWADRKSVRHELILVDPPSVQWRAKAPTADPKRPPMLRLDPETAAARREFLGELNHDFRTAVARSQRDRPNPEAGRSRRSSGPESAIAAHRTCSRPGCGKRLHPRNQVGECESCQHVCPICQGPKTQLAKACSDCGSQGGRRPGEITTTDQKCGECGSALGVRSQSTRCLACRRRCTCGGTKHEDAERCVACVRLEGGSRAATDAPTVPAAPEPAALAPRDGGEAQTAEEGGTAPPSVTLDQLPDYVGTLLGENERMADRIRELEAEVAQLRTREEAWRDVERRVQAVIGRTKRRP